MCFSANCFSLMLLFRCCQQSKGLFGDVELKTDILLETGHSLEQHATWQHHGSSSKMADSHLLLPRCRQLRPTWPAFKIPACSPPPGLRAKQSTRCFHSFCELLLCYLVPSPDPTYPPCFFPPLTSCPVQHPIISELFHSCQLITNLSSLLRSKLMLWARSALYQFLPWILSFA